MLTNAPVTAPSNLAHQQVRHYITHKEWQLAQTVLETLTPNDDIEAIHHYLLDHPYPSLWVTFLENPALQTCFNHTLIQLMYDYYNSLQVTLDYDVEWEVVHSLLFSINDHFTKQQLARIANVKFNEKFNDILNDLLSSKVTALWFAFINQSAIMLGLRQEHYERLLEKLSQHALTAQHEHDAWVILLMLYTVKAYPATYQQELGVWPQNFPIMLQFAVNEISKHCQSDEKESNSQTTKWLCILLKLSLDPNFLSLWQQHATFQNHFADAIKPLASIYILKLVTLFPHQILTVLQDCKTKLAVPGYQKNVLSLIKSLHSDPHFKWQILADPDLCKVLGITYTPEVPLVPVRAAPPTPQRSESLPAHFTPAYQHAISPQAQRPRSEVNIVAMLEAMVLEENKSEKPFASKRSN